MLNTRSKCLNNDVYQCTCVFLGSHTFTLIPTIITTTHNDMLGERRFNRIGGMVEMVETQEFLFERASTTLAQLNCVRLHCILYKIVLY